jgi:hypothetical protein
MHTCLYFTGVLSLLIGFHLFSPKLVHPQGEFSTTNNTSLRNSVVYENGKDSLKLKQITEANLEFEPLNNAGPDNTRGSGTR